MAGRGMRARLLGVGLGVLLGLGLGLGFGPGPLGPRPSLAATFTVDDPGDAGDANTGNGQCETISGRCTLRAAIEEANASTGADTITFSVNGTITLGSTLDVTSDITIIGNGPDKTVLDGVGTVRVMSIAVGATVELRGLTIRNGWTSGEIISGGGIYNKGTLTVTNSTFSGNKSYGDGGGIDNSGTLTVTNSTFSENETGLSSSGGGVANSGTLTVTNSTFSDNKSDVFGGGITNRGTLTVTNSTFSDNQVSRQGGGVYNGGTLTVTNSTFSGNRASAGGGIYNFGTLKVTYSTFSGNRASTAGGGLFKGAGTITVQGTIIANSPAGGDCAGGLTSNGYNLDSDGSCGFTQLTDRRGVDPKLGPLADNGGPTLTHALLAGSPAIDLVNPSDCPPPDTDQRGVSRPQDGDGDGRARCDSGAFELRPVSNPPPPNPPPSSPPPPPRSPSRQEQDDEEDEKLTELQRLQRERTNTLGFEDYRTEGDVLAVDREKGEVVIGTVHGPQTVRLLGEAARQLATIQVGDYLEAEGQKVHEQLFEAQRVHIERRRR